jgi:hypothetical protein
MMAVVPSGIEIGIKLLPGVITMASEPIIICNALPPFQPVINAGPIIFLVNSPASMLVVKGILVRLFDGGAYGNITSARLFVAASGALLAPFLLSVVQLVIVIPKMMNGRMGLLFIALIIYPMLVNIIMNVKRIYSFFRGIHRTRLYPHQNALSFLTLLF